VADSSLDCHSVHGIALFTISAPRGVTGLMTIIGSVYVWMETHTVTSSFNDRGTCYDD